MSIKIFTNYSLNFNPKKRNTSQIKFLIFHYTGMKKESDSIKKIDEFQIRSELSLFYQK